MGVHGKPKAPRRRWGKAAVGVLGRCGVVAVVVAAGTAGVWGLTKAASPAASPTTNEIPALTVQAANVQFGSQAPVNTTLQGAASPKAKTSKKTVKGKKQQTQTQTGQTTQTQQTQQPQQQQSLEQQLTDWANNAAQATGIPPRALIAYAKAELTMRSKDPSCNLSWATIAGIGRVESNHGQYGGATLQDDGLPSKPIIGIPLDGSGGNQAISDTDGGQFDGDKKVDRAVGPMQFIPSTWARYGADGNNDGKADPQNIDDAALTTASYLCAGGRDMSTAKGWWSGLWSYNRSVEYGQKVFGLADGYAKAVAGQQ